VVLSTERYGGLVGFRDSQAPCGKIELAQSTVHVSAVLPSIAYSPVTLENNFNVSVNFTIFAPSYVFVSTQSNTGEFFTRSSIPSNSKIDLLLQIDTGSIDSDKSEFYFNITFLPYSYWLQSASENTNNKPIILTVHLSLTEATFIILPTDIQLTLQEGSNVNRVLTVYNIKTTPQSITVSKVGRSGWVSFSQNQLNFSESVNAGCTCEDSLSVCMPVEVPVSNFSTPFQVIIDTSNMLIGSYSENIRILSTGSTSYVDVPITINVVGGLVDWEKTTWSYSRGLTEDTLNVETRIQFVIIPRDSAGNPTLDFGDLEAEDLTFFVDWAIDGITTTYCPDGFECSGTVFVAFNLISRSWEVDVPVFMNGTYNISIGSEINIPSFPNSNFVAKVLPVTCSSFGELNSEVNFLGNKCSCIPGYGIISDSGFFVKCEECPAGKYSNGTCKDCPLGNYTSSPRQSECATCEGRYQPNELKTGCVKCGSSQYVDPITHLCQQCPPKTIVTEDNECVFCKEREEPKENVCKGCPDNWYVPKDSQNGLCEPCPSDKYPKKGDDGYYTCVCLPKYFTKDDGSCGTCPDGCCCVGRTWKNILPMKKHFKVIVGNVTSCTECRDLLNQTRDNCPGVSECDASNIDETAKAINSFLSESQSADGCTKCGEGFTGPLCVKCALNYHRTSTNDCGSCPDKQWVILAILVGFIAAVSITVYIIRRTIVLSKHEDSTEIIILRIATSSLQLTAMQQGFDLQWPLFLSEFFVVMDYLSSAGQSVFSLDCLVDTGASTSEESSTCDVTTDDGRLRTFFLTAVFIASLPILSLLVSAFFWIVRYFQAGRSHGKTFINYFLVSNVVIFFLLHPTLSRTSLKFFTCSKEQFNVTSDVTVNFLESDFNIVCLRHNKNLHLV